MTLVRICPVCGEQSARGDVEDEYLVFPCDTCTPDLDVGDLYELETVGGEY